MEFSVLGWFSVGTPYCSRYMLGGKMNEFEDLESVAPGIRSLSQEDQIAIQRFTIIWSIFEAKFLSYAASSRRIGVRVDELADEIFNEAWFEDELNYFKTRYVNQHGLTQYFTGLNLRSNDNRTSVEDVLMGNVTDGRSQLKACLIITYRFRNNLFHGDKWAYAIQGQQDNFNHAVELLKKCVLKFRI